MAGQVRRARGRDVTGVFRAKCRGLARAHGYDVEEVWSLWEQLAGCHEFESIARLGREVHESAAWRLVEAVYLKAGQQGD